MSNFDDFKTEFVRSACNIGKLCVKPEYAYKKDYSDFLFAGTVIPSLTYLLFALNLGLERQSFLSSATALKTVILAFFGIIIGFVTAIILAGVAYLASRSAGKEINGFRFLGCAEYSFGISLLVEMIGFIIRLITHENTISSFGILGIFVALISVFRCLRTFVDAPKHIFVCFAALGGILTMLGMNILFFASF